MDSEIVDSKAIDNSGHWTIEWEGQPVHVFHDEVVGIAGTTPCHVLKRDDGKFEARMGFALMGVTNMDEAGFGKCDHNPFHPLFYDNYAHGEGATEEEAMGALKADYKGIADSLWA